MKCSEIEKCLYLYTELTAAEQEETDQHVKTCASCAKIKERMDMVRYATAFQQRHAPRPAHEARLTQKIMSAVNQLQESRKPVHDRFHRGLFMPLLRYSLAGLSAILIAFFIGEYAYTTYRARPSTQHTIAQGDHAELNIASFHQVFISEKRNHQHKTASIWKRIRDSAHPGTEKCMECFNGSSKK